LLAYAHTKPSAQVTRQALPADTPAQSHLSTICPLCLCVKKDRFAISLIITKFRRKPRQTFFLQ